MPERETTQVSVEICLILLTQEKNISEEKTSVESLTKKLWIKKFESEKVSSKLTQIMTANAEKALHFW